MNITIIGTGYVGLVTGSCLAEAKNNIICIDNNQRVVRMLKAGKVPFFEPNLEKIVSRNISLKRLTFSTSYKKACSNDIVLICVDTPSKKSGAADLTNLKSVLSALAKNIHQNTIVVIKSTAPVGTARYAQNFFDNALKNKNIKISVCSNPEFLREGSAILDFQNPSRVILGTRSEDEITKLITLYRSLNINDEQILVMSPESAELTKYSANSFLATKISFINEIAKISETVDANILDIKKGIGLDPRIGIDFLHPGLGFGGSCFPKDIAELIKFKKKRGLPSGILESTQLVNEQIIPDFSDKIIRFLGDNIKNSSIHVWGLAFKPNTDDVRYSLSIRLVKLLASKIKKIYAYDPVASANAKKVLKDVKNIKFIKTPYSMIKQSDILIICTEWNEFKKYDLHEIQKLKRKAIFDGRNFLSPKTLSSAGVDYFSIGSRFTD